MNKVETYNSYQRKLDNIFKQFIKDFYDDGIYNLVIKEDLTLGELVDFHDNFSVSEDARQVLSKMLELDYKIHKYIKDVVQSTSANNLVPKVIYDGSVTDKNAESFFKEEFVDGALVGGASLNGTTFANIVNIWRENII